MSEQNARRWVRNFARGMALLTVSVKFAAAATFHAAPPGAILEDLEKAISIAIQQDDRLLAPARFREVKQLYDETEEALRKGEPEKQLRLRIEKVTRALTDAEHDASRVRSALADVIGMREAALKLDAAMPQRLVRAEQTFADAAAKAEVGDAPEYKRLAQTAALDTARTVLFERSRILAGGREFFDGK